MATINPVEIQKRKKNRGLWHICAWCSEEFEGEPCDTDCCSEDCAQERYHHRQAMEDLMWCDYYEWEDV